MYFRRRHAFFLFTVLAMVCTAGATYAGDRPLNATFFGDQPGGYLFSFGDSVYSNALDPKATYTVNYSITVPDDGTIQFQRLYVYWAWSRINQKAFYPVISLQDSRSDTDLIPVSRYTDSKGFAGTYDFYSGMDAYELPPLRAGPNTFSVTLHQDGPTESSVLVFGMGVLAVYESPTSPRSLIWVREGSDLLFSSYGVSPEMASTEMTFEGEIPTGKIDEAQLFLIAPSGGYSRDLAIDINTLMVNRLDEEQTPPLIRTIFSLLFPNYRGKEWSDIFSLDNTTQIGFETKDIRPYLRTEENRVVVRDQGDYFQLTNAILCITITGDTA